MGPSTKTVGNQFATRDDFAVCAALHRHYGTTYYVSSRLFPREVRQRVDAVYGFVRVPDEWVDNPGTLTREDQLRNLERYREALIAAQAGVRPEDPVLRAFADVMQASRMTLDEPLCFLDAMVMDLTVTRYATYADLQAYMRGSACAVGLMMCQVVGAARTPEVQHAAMALGEAMQLTNFLRDVGEDLARGRVYLPQADFAKYGVSEAMIRAGIVTDPWRAMMAGQISRARDLYGQADPGIPNLPPPMRRAVRMARLLYARILDRIEANDYDVFARRARTSSREKLGVAARVLLGRS